MQLSEVLYFNTLNTFSRKCEGLSGRMCIRQRSRKVVRQLVLHLSLCNAYEWAILTMCVVHLLNFSANIFHPLHHCVKKLYLFLT